MHSNMAAVELMKFLAAVVCLVVAVTADSCENPQVNSNIYTTTDGTVVTHIGFIAEFTVSCSNNVKNLNLYAEVNGKTMPVTRSIDGNKYQVSWTSDPKEVKQYSYPVKVFDEDGFAAVRKAQRSGEDISNVPSLFTLDVQHKGTYNGPWFQSELMAAFVAIGVWYFAFSAKKQLMS